MTAGESQTRLYILWNPENIVNNYYSKSKHGGRFISHKGRKFRAEVADAIGEQASGVFVDHRMLVEIILFPPDKRVRDVDNYNKALLDAISEAGLWEDDQLIDQLFVYRGEVRSRNGSCYVRIMEAAPIITDASQLPE